MGAIGFVIVFFGALAGSVVNGLTGFGTAIATLGIWVRGLTSASALRLNFA
jgi:hypothetical protein